MSLHGTAIATIAALEALDDTLLNDSIPYFVIEKNAWYTLQKASEQIINSDTVIATNSDTGRWLQTYQPDISNLQSASAGLDILTTLHQAQNPGILSIGATGLELSQPSAGGGGVTVAASADKWVNPPSNNNEIWIQEVNNPPRRRVWIGKQFLGAASTYSWCQLAIGNIVDNGNPNEFYYDPSKGRYVPILPDYLGQIYYDSNQKKMYISITLGQTDQKLPWFLLVDVATAPNNPHFVDPYGGF